MSEISDAVLARAVISDPERVKLFEQFHAEREAIEQGQAAVAEAQVKVDTMLVEARRLARTLQMAAEALSEREKKLAADTAALTAVVKTHEDERARWEAMRKKVDADHIAREAALSKAEERHLAAAAIHQEREISMAAREAEAEKREALHKRRDDALRLAMTI